MERHYVNGDCQTMVRRIEVFEVVTDSSSLRISSSKARHRPVKGTERGVARQESRLATLSAVATSFEELSASNRTCETTFEE